MNFGIIPAAWAPALHSVLRILAGLSFLEHGTGKILGFPALPGLDQLPAPLLYFTGYVELIGGVLIVIGLFTRPVAFVLSGFMAVAFFMVHVAMMGHGSVFPAINGGEAAYLYTFVFLYLASAGPGPWSVDKMMS
jgi:putative oxidoreductase